MTCRLRSFVYPLVYGLTKISSLDKARTFSVSCLTILNSIFNQSVFDKIYKTMRRKKPYSAFYIFVTVLK